MDTIKLFVSNLAPEVTDQDLLNLLPGKRVIKAFLAVTKERESRGFGFITIAKEDAPAFLNLDSTLFKSRPLVINHAVDKENKADTVKYFVRNLAYATTKADLRIFLSEKGILPINVVVVLKPDEETQELKSRGFGFVLVYKKDEAKLMNLTGLKLKGRPLSILPYKEPSKPKERP